MQNYEKLKNLTLREKAQLVTGCGFWYAAECKKLSQKAVKLSDGPNGMRVQEKRPSNLGLGKSKPATCFPTASAVACSFNEQLAQRVGEHIGREAAAQKVSMVLGPGLNLKRSPLCGRNFEYFSEDAILSGKLAAAYVRGIQSNGVTACVKHFAANCREYARMYCDSRVDMQTLREAYLTGFEIAIKQGGAGAVMSAYSKLNGEYCNQNSFLLNDVLRGEWGFNGVVVSDWGGSHNPVAALAAGADLEMPKCRISAQSIVEAVEDGSLQEDVLNAAVMRILNFASGARANNNNDFNVEQHDAFAGEVARECIVLLKNEGVLPLKQGERVALIGDFAKNARYQGAGSSQVNPTKLTNLCAQFKNYAGYVGYAQGFKRFGKGSKKLLCGALKLAQKADTLIVCLGLDEQREAEGSDRADLLINQNQVQLLRQLAATGKKIAVVLTCGSVVQTDWDKYAGALVLAHLGGQAGARAVFEVLTGKVNPSGRLAETYPLSSGDEACAAVYNQSPFKTDFAEGIFVGYKYYTSQNKAVKYPFGYGLSYTDFSYSNFALTEYGVEVTVKNVGDCFGATVLQVYVQAPRSNVQVSPAELKLFKKVFLQPGEEARVQLAFDEYTFRVWQEGKGFTVGGNYVVSLREDCTKTLFEGLYKSNLPAPDCGKALTYEEYFNQRLTAEESGYEVYKKMPASPDMQVADLRYCKGITAKLFAYIAKRSGRSKDKMKAGMLAWLPVRTLMQFMGLNDIQAHGFILMCDGHFFKGLIRLLKFKGRKK